jgi:hypothetical protein
MLLKRFRAMSRVAGSAGKKRSSWSIGSPVLEAASGRFQERWYLGFPVRKRDNWELERSSFHETTNVSSMGAARGRSSHGIR